MHLGRTTRCRPRGGGGSENNLAAAGGVIRDAACKQGLIACFRAGIRAVFRCFPPAGNAGTRPPRRGLLRHKSLPTLHFRRCIRAPRGWLKSEFVGSTLGPECPSAELPSHPLVCSEPKWIARQRNDQNDTKYVFLTKFHAEHMNTSRGEKMLTISTRHQKFRTYGSVRFLDPVDKSRSSGRKFRYVSAKNAGFASLRSSAEKSQFFAKIAP